MNRDPAAVVPPEALTVARKPNQRASPLVAAGPNQKWFADPHHVPTWEGYLTWP
jgi:hypothetical protein